MATARRLQNFTESLEQVLKMFLGSKKVPQVARGGQGSSNQEGVVTWEPGDGLGLVLYGEARVLIRSST